MCQFSLGFLSLPVIGGSFTNDKHRKSQEVIAELVENKDIVVSDFDFFSHLDSWISQPTTFS